MPVDLRDATAAELLAAADQAVRARRLAEVADLQVLVAWADMHGADPLEGLDAREAAHARRIGKVLRQVGGEGTPGVQDFCLGEIAMARGAGDVATRHKMADALDLVHRLPATWAVCLSGAAEVWVACRVAKLSRDLPLERVWVVDQAVARMIATESAGRTLKVAEAKVVEADAAACEERAQEAEGRRFAAVGQSDEDKMRMVVARVTAADGAALDALLDRLAELVLIRCPDASLDERRSIAMGYVARPAWALGLLLRGLDPQAAPDAGADSEADPEARPGELPRAFALPADVLALLGDPAIASRVAPQATLYVHLHETTLLTGDGVARVEGLGPVTLSQLQVLLAGHRVRVQPVIDLADRVRTTAYEHPESLKARVHLVTDGDYWPYAVSTSRHVDYDHPTPYRPDPPPDAPPQTGTHNSGPLGRRHHRWKTFAGYRSRQCGHGRYVWLTPHGLGFLVDHRGTRRIDPAHARQMLEIGDGVELYFPEHLEVELAF